MVYEDSSWPANICRYLKKSFIILFVVGFLFPTMSFAQTVDSATRKAQLEAELAQVQKEIDAQSKLLASKQKETASIERDLSVLTYKINTAKLNIKAKQLEIERLGSDIGKKETKIGSLNNKIDVEKTTLAELLRKMRDMDDTSIIEVALANDTMSGVYADIGAFDSIQNALHYSFNVIRETKQTTESEKTYLEKRRNETIDAKKVIEAETKKVQVLESQKKDLLKISKNQEANYQTVLANQNKRKQEILSALFSLRDSAAIPFEKALAYAREAEKGTGVRAAFVLAILTQESNLGENVGRCNRPGDPVEKNWKNIMPGPEDIAQGLSKRNDEAAFLRITQALGLNADTVPLSCPYGNGWGGAMGPSQFIPTTWELYQSRIATVTGNNPPNPWNAEDAFAATAIYLKDLGAAARTYTAEHTAAAKYYAGGRWATAGQSYGNSVMGHASRIQTNIDYLQNN